MSEPDELSLADMNRLPIDKAWLETVSAAAETASRALGAMVVLVAIQPLGKLAISIDGVPDEGELRELAKDVPRLLLTLASITAMVDERQRADSAN